MNFTGSFQVNACKTQRNTEFINRIRRNPGINEREIYNMIHRHIQN